MQINQLLKDKTWASFEKKLPLFFFLLGIWYFGLRILNYLQLIPGDLGDARFINYLLEHGHLWFTGQSETFWNAPFMYPFEQNIAISDNMLGTMPFYSFFRTIGIGQETAYQLWWLLIVSLNYWCTYVVLKKWFGRTDLAIAGAWIFAFSIFNMGQLNYMQMTIRFMVPIVIYAAIKLVETGSLKYFTIFCFGSVFQFYSVIYTGFFLFYFSIALILIYTIITKRWLFFLPLFSGWNTLYSTLVLGISTAAMLWLILPYYEISQLLGTREYSEAIQYVPFIESYFFPHESTLIWTSFYTNFKPPVEFWWIHNIFAGILPVLTFVSIPLIWLFAIRRKFSIHQNVIAVSILAFLIVLFYIKTDSGNSLYSYIFRLPGMDSIRVVNRFMHVELFLVVVVMIALFNRLPKKFGYLLLVVAFIDNSFESERVVRTEKREIIARRTALVQELKQKEIESFTAFAVSDTSEIFFITHIDAMIASLYVNKPTLNGYSSSCPGDFSQFGANCDSIGLSKWMQSNSMDKSEILILR